MKVEQLMMTSVRTCHANDPASVAAQLMWDGDCGTVPVVDDASKVVGMVTDRDLCMASYLEGKPLHAIEIQNAMSHDVWSCTPKDDLATAESIMRQHRVRRLPVTDGEGRLRGILSLSDLSREALKEARNKPKNVDVSFTDVAETLGDIIVPNEVMGPVRAS